MRHDTAIPRVLHDEAAASVKSALGAFWSSVFRDQDLVDALILSRVLSAGQLNVDAMEALSLRDHAGSPVFHREHWHPLAVRLSRRNTTSALTVGMPDTPVLGPQDESGEVYLPHEMFVIGGNALYSKVNTYPIEEAGGCRLVRVATALCDSVSSPAHILLQGRDFAIERDTLVIRKEHDPFDTEGYRIEEDQDDRVAVLWACDAEFDWDNVADFVGYPLGLYAPSTESASKMLSALWDAVTLGLTPITLNKVLGAAFGVPVAGSAETVESVSEDGDDSIVVTDGGVYRIETSRLSAAVKAGVVLKVGDFLTDEITTYWGLSADDVAKTGLGRISIPPGGVAGVDSTVVIEHGERTMEDGGWFKLTDGDSADSPFWRAVFSRTTQAERESLFRAMAGDGGTVDPFTALGPAVLANLILVSSSRAPVEDACTGPVLDFLRRLVPPYASLLLMQETDASDGDDVMALPVDDSVSESVVDGRGLGEVNLFSPDAWKVSRSGAPANSRCTVSVRDGAVTVTATDDYAGNLYTYYARTSLSSSRVYGMRIPDGTVSLRISLTATPTLRMTRSAGLQWFYYDENGNHIEDRVFGEDGKPISGQPTYTRATSRKMTDGAAASWSTVVTPPEGARYLSVFFAVAIDVPGESCSFSDISISPVSQDSRIAISDSAVFRLIPVAATEV